MTLSVMANIILFWKVAKARAQLITFQRSGVSYKAELSLSITTVTMILFYVINGTFVVMYILYYGKAAYFTHLVTLKSFANDLQTCVIPWIFYLTHPVFRKKTITTSDVFVSTSSFKRRVMN
ncbi:Protein CBG24168 [Caenorhabditis briggsae]|nr:Protein CBG24168 [Caenorhabditis briggsae]CCG58559.1 Protein CBG24168 [Caenorhabditis briggsae]